LSESLTPSSLARFSEQQHFSADSNILVALAFCDILVMHVKACPILQRLSLSVCVR